MVLGKLLVPGRPTSLEKCGLGLFGHFSFVYYLSFLSHSLWETAGYRLKFCLKGPLNQQQPTNQSNSFVVFSLVPRC